MRLILIIKQKNRMIKKSFLLIAFLSVIWVNYKVFHSATYQGYLMFDFNSNAYNLPLELVMDVDPRIPNLTFTTMPIKYLQARYFHELDSIEIAKKMYQKAININPYLKVVESELSRLYMEQGEYDSAYYYSKIAFNAIPNSNPHRYIYFSSLARRKDTVELRRAFNRIKHIGNTSHWKEYFLRRYQIVGSNDKEINQLLNDYKSKFDLESDKGTQVLESILKSGSDNVYLSVELSLKADELFQQKEYLEAAKIYEIAIDFDNTDYRFYENAAISYNLGENYDKAKENFKKVINVFKPNNGKAEFYYGIMLIKLKEIKEGCLNLQKAVNLKFSGQGSLDVYNLYCSESKTPSSE